MRTVCECGAEIEPDKNFEIRPYKEVFMMECEKCHKKHHVQIVIRDW